MDSQKVMILGANRYSFEDKNTGRTVTGTTVHYVQLIEGDNEDRLGFEPTKATLSYDYFNQLEGVKFPLIAEASIQINLANKRNPIKVKHFNLMDSVVW